jgi:hypothetical protein
MAGTLISVLIEASLGQSLNPRTSFDVDRQAIFEGSAPGGSYPQDPVLFVGENIGRHTVIGS